MYPFKCVVGNWQYSLKILVLAVIVLVCDRAKFVEFGKDLPRAICGVLNALDAHIFVLRGVGTSY